MLTDTRRLDDVLGVGPLEPMTDDELAAMLRDAEARGIVPTPLKALARLLDELRALPDGVATQVRADLLIADVLEALGRAQSVEATGDDLPDLYATCGTCQAEVPFERRYCQDCGTDLLGDGEHA